MRTGLARKDITPEIGIDMSGYLARVQPSTGIHDKLYTNVLFMESGKARFLWIHCDLIGFSNSLASDLREKISGRTGISLENIMLSATHTHSGPATFFLRNCGKADDNYLKNLEENILAAVEAASSSLEDVSLHFTETEINNVCIDRTKSKNNSHVDKRLPLLAFKRSDGSFAAIVTNLAMHNVALTGDNRCISGDIAGFVAENLSGALPGRPVIFFTAGGAGNINPSCQAADFSAVEKQGTEITEAILRSIPMLERCKNEELNSSASKIKLSLEIPSKEEVENILQKHLDGHAALPENYVNKRLVATYLEWGKHTLKMIEGKNPAFMETEAHLHLLKIGPCKFAGINAEVFSHMADNIRAATKNKNLYVIGYTDGCIGYMAPGKIYAEGGYAISEAYKFYGNFRLKAGAFEEVEDRLLKDLQNL